VKTAKIKTPRVSDGKIADRIEESPLDFIDGTSGATERIAIGSNISAAHASQNRENEAGRRIAMLTAWPRATTEIRSLP
jgi:hypothetical protein